MICYAVISLIVSKEFCFIMIYLIGMLFLLVYPRDPLLFALYINGGQLLYIGSVC